MFQRSRQRALLVLMLSTSAVSGCKSDADESEPRGDDAGAREEPREAGAAPYDASRVPEVVDAAVGTSRSDAATADAQVVDARSVASDGAAQGDAARDASADAGATTACGASGLLFCEDFEQQALGTLKANARFQPTLRNGSLEVDAMHARGERALHVHAQGGGFAYLELLKFAPPNNSFFGRMHAWVDILPTAPNYAHYTLFEAGGMQPGPVRAIGGQYVMNQGNFLGPGTDGGPTGDWTNWKSSAPFAARTWVCFEWELSAADNTVRVWMDGVAKPDLTVSTKKHGGNQVDFVFPTFNKAWFGWWLYQSGTTPAAFDVWLDDLALASTRLGC